MWECIIVSIIAAQVDGLTESPVEKIETGFQFTEGPVYLPTGEWVFSDIPADTIYKIDKTEFRKPSGKSNGLVLDGDGRLIACEHWNRRVTRTESDGSITVLADEYKGEKFNSPNDAVVRHDGSIFFTDPPYGLEGRDQDQPVNGVYRIDPDGTITLLVEDMNRPNGIVLSPDHNTLYIADSRDGFIRAYDVAEDGSLSNEREFAKIPGPDGMAVDVEGRIWSTAGDGIHIFAPDGERLGIIKTEKTPANCAFGGEDGKTLLITARTDLYRVHCTAKGLSPGKRR